MNCSHRVLCQGGLSPWQDYWRTGGSWRDIEREKWVDAKRERERDMRDGLMGRSVVRGKEPLIGSQFYQCFQ